MQLQQNPWIASKSDLVNRLLGIQLNPLVRPKNIQNQLSLLLAETSFASSFLKTSITSTISTESLKTQGRIAQNRSSLSISEEVLGFPYPPKKIRYRKELIINKELQPEPSKTYLSKTNLCGPPKKGPLWKHVILILTSTTKPIGRDLPSAIAAKSLIFVKIISS